MASATKPGIKCRNFQQQGRILGFVGEFRFQLLTCRCKRS